MKKEKKNVYEIINNIIRVILIISLFPFFIKGEYNKVGYIVITVLLTFYDVLVKKLLKIELSYPLKYAILFLIITTEFLGSTLDFYGKFHWWDTFVHGTSGIMNFFIGLELINKLNQNFKREEIHIVIQILFAICFSISILGLWEIAEFILDETLNLNMQITRGLEGQDAIWDTIEDMIAASIGTIIALIIEIFCIRYKNKNEYKMFVTNK